MNACLKLQNLNYVRKMYVRTIKTLEQVYRSYLLKQKATLIEQGSVKVARVGDEEFIHTDFERDWWNRNTQETAPLEIQTKLNLLLNET